jgi:NAD+ synthase (glutamine-hydrolysing)
LVVDLANSTGTIAPADFEPEAEVWSALVLGVRDYARKTHFRQVLLGLSGGIDSALTAAIAADAMGAENVLGVLMPSKYSSQGSVDDSLELARNLGIRTVTLPISEIMGPTMPCWRTYSAAASPMSPRRISSRAFAAAC